jgi:hypothetical protein
VSTLIRFAVVLACTLGAARSDLRAQVVSPGGANGAPTSELAALLSALPKWSVSTSLTGSYGFKDNLLLSSAGEERSPFARGSVEFVVVRAPRDRFDLALYAEIEGTRYTSAQTVDDDSKIWTRSEPAYRFGESLRLALPVTAYYYDQVFDFSDTEVERLVAEVKVKGIMFGPTLRWDFHPSWWVEAQGVGHRKRYADEVYDGDIGEGNLRLGWVRGRFSAVMTGAQRWHDFVSRVQYSSPGRELPGTSLKVAEREGEMEFGVTWDEAMRWQTSTRLGVLHYRDNGSGYLNFRRERVAQELKWDAEPWLVRIEGSAGRVDYDVQTVGLGVAPPARLRDEFSGEVYVARMLSSRWTIFARYLWERSRSNEPVASYTLNEGLLGVRWSWEK